jgi:hypothetical protein
MQFGGGIDRASANTLLEPGDTRDLRNVDLGEGLCSARKGLQAFQNALLLDGSGVAMDEVVLIAHANRGTSVRQNLVLAYEDGSKKLQLFHADPGDPFTFEANWHTFGGTPNSLRFTSAEVGGRFFVAHDPWEDYEPGIQHAVTRGWNGTTTDPLNADLGGGAADIKFVGVCEHLGYLFGWGYGNNSTPFRPELVRASLPGQPTVFHPEHYFIAGALHERVMTCISQSEQQLLVFKQNQILQIVGANRANFGIWPLDDDFGLVGTHMAVKANGITYFWSAYGPRATSGGPSVDLGLPLELDAPAPADLVESGEARDGFAVWVQAKRQVRWHVGRRVYVLHLREPANPRWSYHEYAVDVRCGGDLLIVDATPQVAAYGRQGSNKVLQSDMGHQDDGNVYRSRPELGPVAPAGADGECLFTELWLAIEHTMAVTLRVTPIVDDVALPSKDIVLGAQATRTKVSQELSLEVTTNGHTHFKRGRFFAVRIETRSGGAPGLATGDLIFEHATLCYEVVRESLVAA